MIIQTYAERITEEYNKWKKLNDEAQKDGSLIDEGVTAFMCNAISIAVSKSSHEHVKKYFAEHARY